MFLEEKRVFYITKKKFIMFKSLVGDVSDNIKGVKGVGKRTASKVLQYQSIEEFIGNNKDSRIAKILLSNEKVIEKNKKLINMNKDLDVSRLQIQELSDELFIYKTYEIIENIGER